MGDEGLHRKIVADFIFIVVQNSGAPEFFHTICLETLAGQTQNSFIFKNPIVPELVLILSMDTNNRSGPGPVIGS